MYDMGPLLGNFEVRTRQIRRTPLCQVTERQLRAKFFNLFGDKCVETR